MFARRTVGTAALIIGLALSGSGCGEDEVANDGDATSAEGGEASGDCVLSKAQIEQALSHLSANGGDFTIGGELKPGSNEFVSTCTFAGKNDAGSTAGGEVGIMTDEEEADRWITRAKGSSSAASSTDDGVTAEIAKVFSERDLVAHGEDNEGIVEVDGTYFYARLNWSNGGRSGVPQVFELLAATVEAKD